MAADIDYKRIDDDQPDGSAIWTQTDGQTLQVIIEHPASFMHGERWFVVRHPGKRVWQMAPGSQLTPVYKPSG